MAASKKERRGGWNRKYATPEEAKEAHRASARLYNKTHLVSAIVTVNMSKEPEIAKKLKSVDNRADYIKGLIRKDLGIPD